MIEMEKITKYLLVILAIATLIAGAAEVMGEGIPPTVQDVGKIVSSKHWNFNNIQAVNLSNITYYNNRAWSNLSFTDTLTYNQTVNFSSLAVTETFRFMNGSLEGTIGNFDINVTSSRAADNSCSQFVTKVNAQSKLVTAGSCSGNTSTLTAKNSTFDGVAMTTTTNVTGASFTGSTLQAKVNYLDLWSNETGEDLIVRSVTNDGITPLERFRVKANITAGNGVVFNDLVIPVRSTTPVGAINGTMWVNTTSNTVDIYYNGNARYIGNMTVKV